MSETTLVETLVRRDRVIVAAGLATITVLAWWWTVTGAGISRDVLTTLAAAPDGAATPWGFRHWLLMTAMWWVMMIAMMVPSASPMILLYARVARHGQKRGQIAAGPLPTGAFAFGYLAGWLGFSVAATALQATAESTGLLHSETMASTVRWVSAGVLIAAGVYQFAPLKHACLTHCRSPVEYLSKHWRTGFSGALRMGLEHGLYCLGCCWFLMVLLFVGGVMNLLWIAGLAVFVLAEKLAPGGHWISRIGGAILVAAGAFVAVAG